MVLSQVFRAAALSVIVAVSFPATAFSAEPTIPDHDSLALVPSDATFYVSLRRLREQIDVIAQSNAWAKLNEIEMVQFGWMMLQMQMQQPGQPFAQIQEFFAEEENQPLADLLLEAVSSEIFISGGAEHPRLMQLLTQFSTINRFAPVLGLMTGDPDEIQRRMLSELLMENLDQLVAPTTMVGFKIENRKRAEEQLARLETVLAEELKKDPRWEGRLTRTKIGEEEYLTLSLDGKMVPWNEVRENEEPFSKEQMEKLIQHFEKATVVITLGVKGDYLLLGVAQSAEHLKRLGSEPLRNLPELKRYLPFADRRVTDISYLSREMVAATASGEAEIAAMKFLTEKIVPETELSEEQKAKIIADVQTLTEAVESLDDEAGPMLTFDFLTPRGTEGYTVDWSQLSGLDASKPLSLLQHLGGAPLIAVVGRVQNSPQDYEEWRELAILAFDYFEEFALPEMDEESRELYDDVKEDLLPLVARLDKVTSSKLLPALADGQTGFVLDADLTSRQWMNVIPPTAEALPMPHPALLFGVSDAKLLVEAMSKYRKIINKGLSLTSQYQPEFNFQVPPPATKSLPAGQLFYYDVLAPLGVDEQLAPCAALSDEVAVLAIAPKHAERLLQKSPFQYEGPLRKAAEPLAAAVYVDFAGILQTATPWIEFGVRQAHQEDAALRRSFQVADQAGRGEGLGDPANDTPQVKKTLKQVHLGLQALSVIRSYSSATYEEDGALVTHGELHVVDADQ